jgi:putative ABC transport system permease protein
VRSALTLLQFAILIGIAVLAITVARQLQFSVQAMLRVPADQILLVNWGCEEAFKDEVRKLPGVRAVACSTRHMLNDSSVESRNGNTLTFRESSVDYGFLELYGEDPLAGRFFQRGFGNDAVALDAAADVRPNVVINESALHTLGYQRPAEAIGTAMKWAFTPAMWTKSNMVHTGVAPSTIIGVVPDFSLDGARERIPAQVYVVDPQQHDTLSVRLDGSRIPESLVEIDRLSHALRTSHRISRMFLSQQLEESYRDVMREEQICRLSAGLALVLGCIGLFGLAALGTQRRLKEIGVRKALGAGSADVVRLLVWRLVKPAVYANLLAWPLAFWIARDWLESFAYHVDPALWTFVTAGAAAIVVAAIAVLAQALLAARARPVIALRYE